MQIDDSVRYVDGGHFHAVQDHPVGEVTLGVSGALGLRSRLLGTADSDSAASLDMPYTTGTVPLS
ncbi:hypothetical protein ACIGBL_20585 [Streptomyces sp. NPDC085614]|uniref:hypothetical protein n=1 Tax=Streptomyces sp. NPDC085614 TaxID=3365733 RepID=UPI0037D9577E